MRKNQFASVSPEVTLQVCCTRELFPTLVADEGFLASMHASVHPKLSSLSETKSTLFAAVRLYTVVRLNMHSKSARIQKCLSTLDAKKRLRACMRSCVTPTTPSVIEPSVAHSARVRFLTGMGSEVHAKALQTREEFATVAADVWPPSGVNDCMVLQLHMFLELLSAHIAQERCFQTPFYTSHTSSLAITSRYDNQARF